METESLFSSTRWEILRALSSSKMSPMELADLLKTTPANISQQLRLLELAGLVKSEKTSNIDKGKPRILYSIAGDSAYIILASPFFTDKKLIALTSFQKFMLRTLFLDDAEIQKQLIQIYYRIMDGMPHVRIIGIKDSRIIIVLDDLKHKDQYKLAKHQKVRFLDLSNYSKDMIILYDPTGVAEVKNNE